MWWKGKNQAKLKQERASNGSSVKDLFVGKKQLYVELQFCLATIIFGDALVFAWRLFCNVDWNVSVLLQCC